MIVLIFNFSLGFFGAVHSGILNSIASYNYSLETFRFKSNLVYFRPGGGTTNYAASLSRVHGTIQDGSEDSGDGTIEKTWPATMRGITFNYKSGTAGRDLASVQDRKAGKIAVSESDHSYAANATGTKIWAAISNYQPKGGDSIQTPRIWIKTVYGICLNADCEKK
ncbi:MAG: hypothetical protein H7256_10355 [Bdellovibrio sp.]|nr:hypothetical protein [Bdellovibrio sp.]